MAQIKFTYALSGGTGDATCFAELDGRADVFESGCMEIQLYDYTTHEYIDAPEFLRDMIDLWIRAERSDDFHAALAESQGGAAIYSREMARDLRAAE